MDSKKLTTSENSRLTGLLRWVLGALFIYAGILKAFDPAELANDIANYQLVSWRVAVAGALYLPWLEIFCGLALISGKFRDGALRILLLLMLIFIQALLTAWLRGLNIHCGCFGRVFASSNYALLFLRDLLMLAGIFWLLLHEWKIKVHLENVDAAKAAGK